MWLGGLTLWDRAIYGGGGDPSFLFENPEGTMVGLERGFGNGVHVWTQINGSLFIQQRFDLETDATDRISWRRTCLCDLKKVYPVRELTFSGSWSQLTTHGSGVAGKYVGDRGAQTASTNSYAEVAVSRAGGKSYDVWIAYTKRTSGALARVSIDGVDVLTFSTVGAVDLTRRQWIKAAEGLTGNHTVRVTQAGSAGGANLLLEAIAISGDIEDDKILPPMWQTGTAYAQGDEVQNAGVYYCATAAGTSGANAPTHTSGTASDGAVTWSASIFTSYLDQVVVDYASEREYAATADIGGTDNELGGQTHGNDASVSRSWEVDGVSWDDEGAYGAITVGAEAVLTEQSTWQHASDATMATADLVLTFTPGQTHIAASVEITTASVGLGYLYTGMMPAVRWDGIWQRDIFTRFISDRGHSIVLDAYAGASNPSLDLNGARAIGVLGTINGGSENIRLGYGVRVGASDLLAQTTLSPNVNSRPSASGGTDWQLKGYFNRATNANPETFENTDVLTFEATHAFRLWP
jgi:hypothetical protein